VVDSEAKNMMFGYDTTLDMLPKYNIINSYYRYLTETWWKEINKKGHILWNGKHIFKYFF